jgi:dienelactone hydrolase
MQALRALLCGGFAVGALAVPATANATVRLVVMPAESLIDAPVSIHASGLPAAKPVTITAQTVDAGGEAWVGRATLRADAAGVVDPARERSLGGTYTGRDAMGLFWSMLPKGWHGRADGLGMAPAPVATVRFAISVRGRTAARAVIVRRAWLPEVSVREENLERDGMIGHFCSAPSVAPRPAIVRIGGSEGGLPGTTTCSLLASHGHPTLALAYFGVPGLPSELANIPLEYFQHALQWLARQPGVDPRKLVMMGVSRGGEGALLVASVYPELVHASVGYVPNSYVFPSFPDGMRPAWTLEGQPVPYFNFMGGPTDAQSIQVERIAGPLFVVGAVLDLVWPSADYVSRIADRLRAHGRSDFTALTYYAAGHGIGVGLPFLRSPTVFDFQVGRISLGGTPAGDARARGDSWPKLLAFLSRL